MTAFRARVVPWRQSALATSILILSGLQPCHSLERVAPAWQPLAFFELPLEPHTGFVEGWSLEDIYLTLPIPKYDSPVAGNSNWRQAMRQVTGHQIPIRINQVFELKMVWRLHGQIENPSVALNLGTAPKIEGTGVRLNAFPEIRLQWQFEKEVPAFLRTKQFEIMSKGVSAVRSGLVSHAPSTASESSPAQDPGKTWELRFRANLRGGSNTRFVLTGHEVTQKAKVRFFIDGHQSGELDLTFQNEAIRVPNLRYELYK